MDSKKYYLVRVTEELGRRLPRYEIYDHPQRTNSSHEERTEGWLGTTCGICVDALGEYDTLEAAQAQAVQDSDAPLGDWDEEIGYTADTEYRYHGARTLQPLYYDLRGSGTVPTDEMHDLIFKICANDVPGSAANAERQLELELAAKWADDLDIDIGEARRRAAAALEHISCVPVYE